MAKSETQQDTSRAGESPSAPTDAPAPEGERRRSRWRVPGIGTVRRRVGAAGAHVVGRLVNKLLDPLEQAANQREAEDHGAKADDADAEQQSMTAEKKRRLSALEQAAQRLRGAADHYIATKLDEIETRVDVKLDQIEQRVDHKVRNLTEELQRLRDAELRHRLRLLKVTLIFTVIVALLSLGYKWLSSLWS